MKKVLMCVVTAAFLFGCGGGSPKSSEDGLAADLSKYQGACADIAFEKTRFHMEREELHIANNQTDMADIEHEKAEKAFKSDMVRYNDLKGSVDRANADIESQKARLANVKDDVKKIDAKKYDTASQKVASYHKDADAKLKKCDATGAEVALNAADKEIMALEAMIGRKVAKAETAGMITYVVKKGDCLWKIAANKLNDAYFWPLIYWSNKDSIKDPDLIYPNQKLKIESSYSAEQKTKASKFAKTRGAWSLYDNK